MTIRRFNPVSLAFAALTAVAVAPLSGCLAPESTSEPTPAAPSVVSFAVATAGGEAPVDALFAWQVEGTGSLTCELDLDDDGFAEKIIEDCEQVVAASASYPNAGTFYARLTVRDQWQQEGSQRSGAIRADADPADFPAPAIAEFQIDAGDGYTPQSVVFGWDVVPAGPDYVTCHVDIDDDGLFDHTVPGCDGRGSVTSWIHTGGARTARFVAVAGNGAMSSDTADWSVAAYGLDVTSFSATPDAGAGPLEVTFTWEVAAENASPRCEIDADGDNVVDHVADPCPALGSWSHLYLEPGAHAASLRVTDAKGAAAQAAATVDLANRNPAIRRFVVLPAGPPPSLDAVLVWVVEDADPIDTLQCEIDTDGDGAIDIVASECEGSQKIAWTFGTAGNWSPTLTVRDAHGGSSTVAAAPVEATEPIGQVVSADVAWASHGSMVARAIAWRPDGGALVAVGDAADHDAAFVWDAATGETLLTLQSDTDDCIDVAWSQDGTRIAVASASGLIAVHDAKTGGLLAEFGTNGHGVNAIAWRPDSHQLASAGTDHVVRFWNADAGVQLSAFVGHEAAVTDLSWSPSGARVATSGEDRSIRIFDAATAAQVDSFHHANTAITSISWSSEGDHLASTDQNGRVRIHDPMAGTLLTTLVVDGSPAQIAFSPTGDELAVMTADGGLTFIDAQTLALDPHGTDLEGQGTFAWQPGAGGIAIGGEGLSVTYLDEQLGAAATFTAPSGHAAAVQAVAVSADAGFAASVASDGRLRVTAIASGEVLSDVETYEDALTSVAWAASGSEVYAGGVAGTVSRWDAISGQMWGMFAAHTGPVAAMAVSPDGDTLATASADGVKLWAHDGMWLATLPDSQGATSVAWSPSGDALAVGRNDGWAGVWSAQTAKLLSIWTADSSCVEAVAWNPSGSLVASGGHAGTVSVRNVAAGTWQLAVAAHEGGVNGLQFSPWGDRIASTGADGRIAITEVESKSVEIQAAFAFDDGASTSVAWTSPTGLVAGHEDTTVAALELVTE